MDTRQLAHATAVLLSAYLPFLWHDNLPETEDWRRKEAITRLWSTLRPELGAALQTAIMAADKPSETTLLALSNLLANLFTANTELEKRVDNILSIGPFAVMLSSLTANTTPTILKRQADEWRQQILRPMHSQAPVSTSVESDAIPACQVCGRQDATLRIVAFPFVVSLIFVTFRRAFSGLWCRRHATIRQLVATLITATVGWIGIPFGLIYTPMALLTLARGGDQPESINQRMLLALARHKKQADNDPQEAMRCLESALELGQAPAIEAELRSIYQTYEGFQYGGGLRQIGLFLFTLLAVYTTGIIVGMADYVITSFFNTIMGEEGFAAIGLLSWVPFVILAVTGWLILLQLVESTLRRARIRHKSLAVVLAAFASLLAVYGIPTGSVVAFTLASAPLAQTFPSLLNALFTLSWIVTRGGVAILGNYIAGGTTSEFMYLTILFLMLALYLVSTNQRAKLIAAGYQRIDAIHDTVTSTPRRAPATGWISILAMALILGGLLVVSELQWLTMINYGDPAAMERFAQGMTLLDEGDAAGARATLEEAQSIDPQSFAPYLGLAYVEVLLDNCKEAQTYMQTTCDLAPPEMQASALRGLGAAYRCNYQPDESIAALEEALLLDPSALDIHEDIGIACIMKGDFEAAIEHFTLAAESPEASASSHAHLAIVYYILDRPDEATQEIDQALNQQPDETGALTSIASYYYYLRDYHEAETYLKRGLESSPPFVSSLSALAFTNIYQGDFDEAMDIADRILAIDAQNGEAFAIRSAIYEEQGDLQAAREAAENGLALDPGNETLLVQLAYITFDEKDYEAAIEGAKASIVRSPYYSTAQRLLALSQMEAGRLDEAMRTAQEALELAPKDDLPYYVTGVCYMQAGKKAEAIKAFETFLSLTWDRRLARDYQRQAKGFLAELRE